MLTHRPKLICKATASQSSDLCLWISIALSCTSIAVAAEIFRPALALPPAEDTPEEILRAQPIASGRSPLDNSALSPSEYEQLRAELLEAQETRPNISPRLQRLITLLRLRKLLRSLNPFD